MFFLEASLMENQHGQQRFDTVLLPVAVVGHGGKCQRGAKRPPAVFCRADDVTPNSRPFSSTLTAQGLL